MSNDKIKVRVGDTVYSRKHGQQGITLGFFKSLSDEHLVAVDYRISGSDKGVLIEKETDVHLVFEYAIDTLCAEGLNSEQATFFAPSYHQSLDQAADLIKIKQYLSLK